MSTTFKPRLDALPSPQRKLWGELKGIPSFVTDLELVAKRLFWWQSPEEALSDPIRFLAQVMTYGTLEDILAAKRHFSEDAFREVLANPPAGVFDPRSWHYWHLVFGISPVPDLPKRQFSETPEDLGTT